MPNKLSVICHKTFVRGRKSKMGHPVYPQPPQSDVCEICLCMMDTELPGNDMLRVRCVSSLKPALKYVPVNSAYIIWKGVSSL